MKWTTKDKIAIAVAALLTVGLLSFILVCGITFLLSVCFGFPFTSKVCFGVWCVLVVLWYLVRKNGRR